MCLGNWASPGEKLIHACDSNCELVFRQDNVVAQGLGKTNPVSDNSAPAGRKLNRRVDMVVSGDLIGKQSLESPSVPSTASAVRLLVLDVGGTVRGTIGSDLKLAVRR